MAHQAGGKLTSKALGGNRHGMFKGQSEAYVTVAERAGDCEQLSQQPAEDCTVTQPSAFGSHTAQV